MAAVPQRGHGIASILVAPHAGHGARLPGAGGLHTDSIARAPARFSPPPCWTSLVLMGRRMHFRKNFTSPEMEIFTEGAG